MLDHRVDGRLLGNHIGPGLLVPAKETTMAKKNWKVTGVFSDGDVEVYQFYYTQSAIEVAKDLQESGASVSIERI